MRILFALIFGFVATAAQAQYKCVTNGVAAYSDVPCSAKAKYVGALEDHTTEAQQVQRLRQSIKERGERNRIEMVQDAEFRATQRALENQAAREDVQVAGKASRCAGYQRELRDNQRDQARYRDWGWQNSLTQREAEAKGIKDKTFRDCP